MPQPNVASKKRSKSDPLLANKWRTSRVRRCLRKKETSELVTFLWERHDERFFQPIRNLKSAEGNHQGYGFAMMSLCSLLIETIQSYKDGIPTTSSGELGRLRKLGKVPKQYQIPTGLKVSGIAAFQRFFRSYRAKFPGVSGTRFYKNIRNGLLHQGQTKAGWTLSKSGPQVCDPSGKIICRDNFSEALESCFEDYLDKLRTKSWTHGYWHRAARKIWWLIRLSR